MSAPGAIDPPPGTRLQQGKDVHKNVNAGHPSLAAARGATNADTSQKPGAAAAGGGETAGGVATPEGPVAKDADKRETAGPGSDSSLTGGPTGGLSDIRGGKTGGVSDLTGGPTGTFSDIGATSDG